MVDFTRTALTSEPGTPYGISVRDVLIVTAVYLFTLIVVAGGPHFQAGFPLDDSWIHQVVARNLAHDGTLGFIPKVRSSGSSSLLWSFILAANWKFLPNLGPVLYSAVVSGFLMVATGCGLLAMARKDGLPASACWIWALTPALDGNFMWLGMIGMEHLLFVTLSVLGIYLWFRADRPSAVACALCLGALSLTRPEGLVLTPLAMLAARWAKRSRKDLGILAAVVSVCVAASLLANFITSRSWLPTTYAGRKWLYFGSDKVPLLAHVEFPYALFGALLQPWAVHQTRSLYIVNALVAALTVLGAWSLLSGLRLCTGFLVLWSFIHIAIYMVMLPTRSHGGRYQPLLLALSFPLMLLGVQVIVQRLAGLLRTTREQRYTEWGSMLTVSLLCGVFSLMAWRTVTSAGIALIEGTHAKMGRLMVDSLPAHSKAAALDIGRMGYLFGGNLRDMGGLTDGTFLPYMRDHRVFDYLKQQNIQYLVWPTTEAGDFDVPQILSFTPENSRHLTRMATFCVPNDLWYASYAATLDAAPCQTLFRLQFP